MKMKNEGCERSFGLRSGACHFSFALRSVASRGSLNLHRDQMGIRRVSNALQTVMPIELQADMMESLDP